MTTPFVLRILSGKHAGLYFVRGDYRGLEASSDPAKALRVSADDAYGHIAAAIDMLCTAMVPENVGDAAEDDYQRFGEKAARDMLQKPSKEVIKMFVDLSCRRSADEPLSQPEMPPSVKPGYMSVYEWMHRAWHKEAVEV